MEELFDEAELALLRSTKPIALQVHPNWAMSIVEVRPGLVTAVVGGPQVDTITGGQVWSSGSTRSSSTVTA